LHPSRFSALQFGQIIGLLKSVLRRPRIRLRDQAHDLCLGGLGTWTRARGWRIDLGV